jgi:hypothetical protein
VWLASYPRSGNTLLRIILNQSFGIKSHSLYDDTDDIGSMEGVAKAVGHISHNQDPKKFYRKALRSKKRFFVKTHDTPPDDSPAIYVVRDGRAVSVSYARYNESISRTRKTLTDVVVGNVLFGPWGEHYKNWDPKTRPNTMLLKYEDLVQDPDACIRRIAGFLDLEVRNAADTDFARFQKMYPTFFRQGTRSGWGADVSNDEKAIFWTLNRELMTRLGYDDDDSFTVDTQSIVTLLAARIREMDAAQRADQEVQRLEIDKLTEAVKELSSLRESHLSAIEELTEGLRSASAERQAHLAAIGELTESLKSASETRVAHLAAMDELTEALKAARAELALKR